MHAPLPFLEIGGLSTPRPPPDRDATTVGIVLGHSKLLEADEASRGWSKLVQDALLSTIPYDRRWGFSTFNTLIYHTHFETWFSSRNTK